MWVRSCLVALLIGTASLLPAGATAAGATGTEPVDFTVQLEPATSRYGSPVTVLARVTTSNNSQCGRTGPVSAPMPGGTFTVSEGGTVLATTPAGYACSFDTALPSDLSVGTHLLTWSYSGDGLYAPAGGQLTATRLRASSRITAKAHPDHVVIGQRFRVSAHVALLVPGGPAPGGKVVLFAGHRRLGKATLRPRGTEGVASVVVRTPLKVGERVLVVRYRGSAVAEPSKRRVHVTVAAPLRAP